MPPASAIRSQWARRSCVDRACDRLCLTRSQLWTKTAGSSLRYALNSDGLDLAELSLPPISVAARLVLEPPPKYWYAVTTHRYLCVTPVLTDVMVTSCCVSSCRRRQTARSSSPEARISDLPSLPVPCSTRARRCRLCDMDSHARPQARHPWPQHRCIVR